MTGGITIHKRDDDLPQGVPIWAFGRVHGGPEQFALIHGVYDIHCVDETGQERRSIWDTDVILWSVEPIVQVALFETLLEVLNEGCVGLPWNTDHRLEDWMHRRSLLAVAGGEPDAAVLASIAVKTIDLDFSRHYG